MSLRIGIDSSDNKSRSCCLIGFDTEINKIYSEINKLLKSYNEKGNLHWMRLTTKTRNSVAPKVLKILSESSLRILIFEHKKPENISKVKFFLDFLPNEIAASLERHLKGKSDMAIDCDNDYNVQKVVNSSTRFVEKIMEKLTFRLSGQMTKILKRDTYLKADIVQYPSRNTKIYGKVKESGSSKAIQLADFSLGIYKQLSKSKTRNKFQIKKI